MAENNSQVVCCPVFDPAPWQEKELVWKDKKFVADHITSVLHIPINFAQAMKRNMALIEAAGAKVDPMIVMTDETLWGADLYIEAVKDIPGARTVEISGTFLTRVYEGPYRNIRHWVKDMIGWVSSKNLAVKKLYFYYTTCPKCAKKYGKNYVVILAQV